MVMTRDIRIKVTALQYEIIKSKAQVAGFRSLSHYIRETVLNTDFSAEKLIRQIHELVVKDKECKDAACRGYDEIFKEMEKWIGKTYGRKCPNHRPGCLAWSEWEQFKLKWVKKNL
jgi:hypothetical protein